MPKPYSINGLAHDLPMWTALHLQTNLELGYGTLEAIPPVLRAKAERVKELAAALTDEMEYVAAIAVSEAIEGFDGPEETDVTLDLSDDANELDDGDEWKR